jgi:signal transduction histidine kinase
LLVDDLPANLLALEALLADLGQGLVKAASGAEALRLLLQQDFAVVLLDVRMPGLNGFEVARLMRRRKRSRHTPIIFLTAAESPEFPIVEAYKLGAVDFLIKPLVPEILRAKVTGFVELHRKTEQIKRQAEQLRQLERQEAERRLAEETQRQRAEVLGEEARRKDEFLATLGHELRNPLAALRNGLNVQQLRGLSDPAAEQLHALMERQADLLTRLVDDLLNLSRVSRGLVQLRKERVELGAALAGAAEAVRPLVAERGHELAVTTPPGPVWVEADPARLEQVFVNLLTNAARYTPDGGRIELTGELADGQAVARVRDTGIGIRPEMLTRIFELFAHADRLPGRVQEGLGIGLTLVRSLVEQHGGTVQALSEGPGQGSEFVVRLPAWAGAPAAHPAGAPNCGGGAAPGRPLRVLVVDDNADTAESCALLLRLDGHEVRVAPDGPVALQAARDFAPDAALLDLGLPGMDGYEVARRLRALPETGRALLVAMTGWDQEEDRHRSWEAGFDYHLTKPAPPEEIQRLLKRRAVLEGSPSRCFDGWGKRPDRHRQPLTE